MVPQFAMSVSLTLKKKNSSHGFGFSFLMNGLSLPLRELPGTGNYGGDKGGLLQGLQSKQNTGN